MCDCAGRRLARVKRPVAFLDVFAERPLAGNGLAVVDDADGFSDETMLAFARETRLSETTFVQSADADGADYRNRIWTPGEELPFAGHPSLGTAVAVARWRGDEEAALVQQTKAGPAADRGAARRRGAGWRRALAGDDAAGAGGVRRGAGPRGRDARPSAWTPATPTPSWRPRSSRPASRTRWRRSPTRPAWRGRRPTTPRSTRCSRPTARSCSTWRGSIRAGRAGRAASRASWRWARTRRRARPWARCAPTSPSAPARRGHGRPGRGDGPPERARAEMEGERVRVSGAVLPLIEGTVVLP